jgi:hypothetical protein
MTQAVAGICWPHGGTVGHITVTDPLIHGSFPARHGADGIGACSLTPAGKYRNGAARMWCRTHQRYWGVKADLADLAASGQQRCAGHAAPMGYALGAPVLALGDYASLVIRHSAHGVHIAAQPFSAPTWEATVAACALGCDPAAPLFGDPAIIQVNITPPALRALSAARSSGERTGCVHCARCGHPHLDLGGFAAAQHRRHYCGHCGHDATHSKQALISHPLLTLLSAFAGRLHIPDSNVHGHTVL